LDLLAELRRQEGSTLVLVTHDPAVAALASRRIHLRDGRVELDERDGVASEGGDRA
jgi:putative ABC transport system ATP-binding protein